MTFFKRWQAAALAGVVLVGASSLWQMELAYAQKSTSLTLPELVRRDGVFCQSLTPRKPHVCDSVIRITLTSPHEAWISYTGLVKARNELPAIKMRIGHIATIKGDEVCIQAGMARLTIELFEAVDARIGIAPQERSMDALAKSQKIKLEKTEGDNKITCRGLTNSGHLLTFGGVPKPMRFIPLLETTQLRLHAYGGGL